MHQNLHQNQKSCTKSAPKTTLKTQNKDYVYLLFRSKNYPALTIKTGFFIETL